MAHKYAKYLDNFVKIVQREKEQLSKLPDVETAQMEIVLDNDATEEEVAYYLHHPNAD